MQVWDEVEDLFRECALQTDVTNHIQDSKLRLEACKRANGKRFQQELHDIKRERGLI